MIKHNCNRKQWIVFFFCGATEASSMPPSAHITWWQVDVRILTFKGHYSYYNLPLTKGKILHTYIIGHYNPSVSIIDLVSHTTYVVCVNFIHKWRDLQFKVDSERQIFWETFHGNFIYSQSFCKKSAERKSP